MKVYLINCSTDIGSHDTILISDDSIYQSFKSNQYVSLESYYAEEILAFLDSSLGTRLWNVINGPFYNFAGWSFSDISYFFPKLYFTPTISGDFPLSYRGQTVTDSFLVYCESTTSGNYQRWIANYGTSSNGSSCKFPFISPFNYENISNKRSGISVRLSLTPENYILDGKINQEVYTSILQITIAIRKNYDGEYGANITAVSSGIEPPTQFWLSQNYDEVSDSDDPFNPGGNSGIGGGGGDFDNTSTPIDIPSLPPISASDTGFITLYNPTLSQLNELSQYMWSDMFDIDGWRKLFADPMDAILGLSILPVPIPSTSAKEVKVGNIGTGVSLNVAASQFVEVDCGSINVNEYWGAYLDYEPYTQAQIFLPYIGTRPISVDEIMGKTVRVVYHVDILTGACCCFVKCGDSVLYTYNGQCSIPIPVTGANYTAVVNGVISVAASVGSLVATGGASAPTAIPEIATSAVNQMKPSIEKSGSISGSAGILNMQVPYLILTRPRQALPSKQNEFIGYPSLVTVQLAELSGYTEVQSIHLENIPATSQELDEIEQLLKGGVIF